MRQAGVIVAMPRVSMCAALAVISLQGIWLCARGSEPGDGAQIVGTVRMPEVCSPAVSPAVVFLSPDGRDRKLTARGATGELDPAVQARVTDVALVDQRGLQFTPRVQAIALRSEERRVGKECRSGWSAEL